MWLCPMVRWDWFCYFIGCEVIRFIVSYYVCLAQFCPNFTSCCMWWSQLFALGTCLFLPCLLSLHPCSLSGADAFIGSVLKTVPLTQPTFERYFLSLLFPLSNTDDVNRAHTGPVLQNGHHRSFPSSTPHTLKSHILWPQANLFTSLSSSSLLPKPFFGELAIASHCPEHS